MGFLSLFRSKSFQPEEFEQQLTQLTQAISKNRERIAALTSKQKSYRRSLTLYCTIIYLSYVALRYKTSRDNLGVLGRGRSRLSIFLSGQSRRELATIVFVPVVIAVVVYVVNSFFSVLIRSKNNTLRSLLKKHRAKLDELKQVTNFSRTNQILQKFESENSQENTVKSDANKLSEERRKNKGKKQEIKAGATNIGAKRLPPTVNIPNRADPALEKGPKSTSNRPNMASNIPSPRLNPAQPVPAQLSFSDRLLDYIIGSDHNENVENRYALICVHCYTHNGLAPPGCKDPSNVTFICRLCGFINGELSSVNEKEGSSSGGQIREKVDDTLKNSGEPETTSEIGEDLINEGRESQGESEEL